MRRLVAVMCVFLASATARADKLKQLADLHGARPNQLLGYGLVVGLAGTGDDAAANFSVQSVLTMLQKLGVHVESKNLRLKNIAAVIVTAELPAFVRPGHRLDATVSSIGNAASLEGGVLVAAPLRGADTKVYAVAQGALLVGGFSASGSSGSRLQKNHTTVGRVPNGALVEREPPTQNVAAEFAVTLRTPDFTTAVRIAQGIDEQLHTMAPAEAADPAKPAEKWAIAKDAGTVTVHLPSALQERIPEVWSELERLDISPDVPTRVVVNERTGTVVLGDGVRLSPVAIAHGGLTMEIKETPQVSQPAPFSKGGKTVVVPHSGLSANELRGELHDLPAGASLGDVVRALNTLGVSPRDLVTILQALKASGALRAELEIQ